MRPEYPDDNLQSAASCQKSSIKMLDQEMAGAQDTIYLCNFRVSVDGDWLCLKELQDVEFSSMPETMQRSPSPPIGLSGIQSDMQQPIHDDPPELCDILSSPIQHVSCLCLYNCLHSVLTHCIYISCSCCTTLSDGSSSLARAAIYCARERRYRGSISPRVLYY